MGKTEFLQKDLLPAARGRGYLVAYTNLWDNRSSPDVALISALVEAMAPRGVKAVLAGLRRPVRKLKAGAKIPGGVEGSIEAELAVGEKAMALGEILKKLDGQKKPLLLVIDDEEYGLARVAPATGGEHGNAASFGDYRVEDEAFAEWLRRRAAVTRM